LATWIKYKVLVFQIKCAHVFACRRTRFASPGPHMDLALTLAFAVGLLSSLHCIGMCGGIMGALSYGLPLGVRQRFASLSAYLLLYSLGRILSYAMAGALMGLLGRGLFAFLGGEGARHWLQWAAGLIMVAIGLNLAGWWPRLAHIERLGAPLWRRLEPWGRRLLPVHSGPQALLYGMIWGWLPCGLVYTMLLSSVTRSGGLEGALYMAAFGIGTLPAALATGALTARLHRAAGTPYLKQAVGGMIALFGLITLWYPELLDQGGFTATSGALYDKGVTP
jgi:uncharacterized protein